MDLQELQNKWNEYDKKLDKSLLLNIQLLRKMNFDKAKFKMKMLLAWKLVEMCIFMYGISYLVNFMTKYAQLQFTIAAVLSALLILVYFIMDVRQVILIIQIQLKDNMEAIAPLQKRLENLKLLIVNYVKYTLFFIPLYPLFVLIAGKIYLHVDFTEPQRRAYFLSNVGVALLMLPFVIWFYTELSKKNITKTWVKNLLIGSGWYQANQAEHFLKEIAEFEQE